MRIATPWGYCSTCIATPSATALAKSSFWKSSIWGLVKVYNSLGGALHCSDVKGFQSLFQERVKSVVSKKLLASWEGLYSPSQLDNCSKELERKPCRGTYLA